MNDATLKAEALDKGLIKSTKETLPAQAKALAAVALITKQTSAAHGDFTETQDGLANRTKTLRARLDDLSAGLGEKLLPFVLKAVTAADKLVAAWQNGEGPLKDAENWLKNIGASVRDWVQDFAKGEGAAGRFRDKVGEVVDQVKAVASFIKDHAEYIDDAAQAWLGYKAAAILAGKAGATAAATTGAGAAAGAGGGAAARARGLVGRTAVGFLAIGAAGTAIEGGNRSGIGGVGDVIEGALDFAIPGETSKEKRIKRTEEILRSYREEVQRLAAAGNSGGIRKIQRELADLAKSDLSFQTKDIKDFSNSLNDPVEGLETVNRAIGRLEKNGTRDLNSLRTNVRMNMRLIKERLGEDSEEGKAAISRNFSASRAAVRAAMRDKTVSVQEGMALIRSFMRQELAYYGVTGKVASAIAKHGDINPQEGGAGITRAGGGWIGFRGQAGEDRIPAMLGAGEFVLNRHQQAVVEGMLGQGFLDRLAATVTRPHFLASGGRAPAGRKPLPNPSVMDGTWLGGIGQGALQRVREGAQEKLERARERYEQAMKATNATSATGRGVKPGSGTGGLAMQLVEKFGLSITDGWRPQNAGYGATNSSHKKGSPSNPGAHDFMPPSEAARQYALKLGAKWADIHRYVDGKTVYDGGPGTHLHVSWFAGGGRAGKKKKLTSAQRKVQAKQEEGARRLLPHPRPPAPQRGGRVHRRRPRRQPGRGRLRRGH